MSETETQTTEEQSTTAGSEPNQTTAGADGAGVGGDGAGGGSQTDADTFAAERTKLQETNRGLQAERDRLKAELEAAKKPAEETGTPKPASTEDFLAILDRREAIAAVKATASDKFPNADPTIVARANEFESAEALTVALEASNTALTEHIESRSKSTTDETLKRYVERYGELDPVTPANDGSGSGGDPTIEQLAAMSSAEFDQVPQETVDRVMRSAQGGSK